MVANEPGVVAEERGLLTSRGLLQKSRGLLTSRGLYTNEPGVLKRIIIEGVNN